MVLTNQSRIIADQTPKTPKLKYLERIIPKPILTIHMELTPTVIVKRTSLDALRVFGRVNDNGQIKHEDTPWIVKILVANAPVSGDKLYALIMYGVNTIIAILITMMAR